MNMNVNLNGKKIDMSAPPQMAAMFTSCFAPVAACSTVEDAGTAASAEAMRARMHEAFCQGPLAQSNPNNHNTDFANGVSNLQQTQNNRFGANAPNMANSMHYMMHQHFTSACNGRAGAGSPDANVAVMSRNPNVANNGQRPEIVSNSLFADDETLVTAYTEHPEKGIETQAILRNDNNTEGDQNGSSFDRNAIGAPPPPPPLPPTTQGMMSPSHAHALSTEISVDDGAENIRAHRQHVSQHLHDIVQSDSYGSLQCSSSSSCEDDDENAFGDENVAPLAIDPTFASKMSLMHIKAPSPLASPAMKAPVTPSLRDRVNFMTNKKTPEQVQEQRKLPVDEDTKDILDVCDEGDGVKQQGSASSSTDESDNTLKSSSSGGSSSKPMSRARRHTMARAILRRRANSKIHGRRRIDP